MTLLATPEPARHWPFHTSDMAERIRRLDASSGPLGACRDWPAGLRNAVDVMLPAQAQIVLFWGPEFIAVYNDAYALAIGDKHPRALGSCAADIWRELWDDLGPLLRGVWTTGQTFSAKDRPFRIDRHGYLEEVYFDVSYSALRSDQGEVAGLMCIVRETTQTVRAMRALEASEARLSESHDQLRLAQVAGGVGLFLVNVHQNTITGSKEFFRLFGLPNTDNLPVAELDALFVDVPRGDEADQSAPSSREARVRGDAPLEAEYRIRKADTGEVRWLARRAEFVRDADGKPIFMRGVVQDVTERKAAEATAKAGEARFRALVQTLPNQVWIADSCGQLTWFNQVVCAYTGLDADAMTGQAWTRMVHSDDLPQVVEVWTRCLRTLEPYHIEFRVLRHDGVYRWHLVRAVPIETETGVQWVGANTDVDDQRLVQEGLFALNVRLEKQVDDRTRDLDRMWRLSTDLILLGDTGGQIRSVNPAWELLLGWTDGELVGSDFMRLVHPDDEVRTRAELAQLTRGIITQRFENRFRRRDGSYCSISWLAVPEGRLIHAVGRNVSAERESAEALQQVEERLRQSQKMEALGQLTGGIAHDFNNLLQGISGAIDIVRSRLADGRSDDVERFMDSAIQSAHRAASLIQRLLAFARRQSLDSRTVNVNQLVGSMEDLLGRTLGPQIQLKVAPGADVWLARSDENQLESAILNLAINARDAMPDGGILSLETLNTTLDAAYVRAHEGLQAGDYAVVAVTDTGTGMSPAVLAKVFEPFFTTKPIGQGTGLGLSGIYGFAKQSGGHVRIHSRLGQGTTVRLFLPRDVAVPEAEVPLDVPDIPQGEGETVLVVEDDAAVRMIVLDELSELGYQTLEACDGPTALPILQSSRKIDLLLTDVGLPGMNGRQVAEIGRQHRPGLRVLFMTGYAEKAASREKFLAPGMEMISKPFTMDALAARIGRILRDTAQPPLKPDSDSNNNTEGA